MEMTLTAITLIATLNVSTAFIFPEIADTITLNRATIYSATVNIPLGMSFASVTRELSGTPTDLGRFSGRFSIDYVATDPDEELDEDGNLITPMTLRVGDDDKATLTVVVFVDDEPSFGGQTVSVQSYTQNTSITLLTLPRADGGNTPLKYTLTDLSSLSLSAAGVLSGIPRTEVGVFELIYTVTDTDLPEDSNDSATLTVTVNIDGDSRPEFNGGFGPLTLTQTWPITQPITLPAAMGGNFATLYSIQEEALPGDLRFDSITRGLSGTPTVTGMFTIRLIAEDTDGNTMAIDEDILEVIITVVADIAPVLPAVSNQDYIQNSRIVNLTLPEATGGNGGVTMYSLTPPPTGLTFNSDHTARVLSGTPRVFGNFTLIYIATDSDPVTPEAGPDSATVSITINIEEDIVPSFTESVPQQNYFQGEEIAMTVLPAASEGNGVSLTYEDALGLPGWDRF